MTIPGIDAGNSRFKFSVPDVAGNPQLLTNRFGEPFTPSAVFMAPDGSIIIGTEALNAGYADPDRLIVNWKRSMGTDDVLYKAENGKEYRAKDILSILLQNAKENIESKTGSVVNEAVITVPANYTDAQKKETIEAADQAGIDAILLPHEPTAAALGNGLHERDNCTALVFDLGGGTFDVSIIRSKGNLCEIVATGGDPNVGGRDFNDRIAEQLLDAFEGEHGFRPSEKEHRVFHSELASRVEQLKISLSVQPQASIILFCEGKQLQRQVTREEFNSWVEDLADRTAVKTAQVIKDAGLEMSEIDEVYAVGGGSMMPVVVEKLENLTEKRICRKCEPHSAAALGAVLAGRLEYSRQGKAYTHGDVVLPAPDFFLHDILSHTIGVLVLDANETDVCSQILARDTPIPSVQTKLFKLSDPKQTAATIKVLEGPDGARADNCLALGHFDLNDLPCRPDLIGRIEITFSLDSNGLLTAKARDTASGKTAEMTIDYEASANKDEPRENAA
jgi:molecular chaperone DnaK